VSEKEREKEAEAATSEIVVSSHRSRFATHHRISLQAERNGADENEGENEECPILGPLRTLGIVQQIPQFVPFLVHETLG